MSLQLQPDTQVYFEIIQLCALELAGAKLVSSVVSLCFVIENRQFKVLSFIIFNMLLVMGVEAD